MPQKLGRFRREEVAQSLRARIGRVVIVYRGRRRLDSFLTGPGCIADDVIKHHDPGCASQSAEQALTFGVIDSEDLILVVEILQPAPLPHEGKPLPVYGWNR